MNKNELAEKIEKTSYILFGDIHGTKLIPREVETIVKEQKGKKILCLELPKQTENDVNAFISGKISKEELFNNKLLKDAIKDKRFNEDIANMIHALGNSKVTIKCLEDITRPVRERDLAMAQNFMEISKEKADKYFVLIGNLHLLDAPKRIFLIFKINPFMMYLSDEIKKNALRIYFFKSDSDKIEYDSSINSVNILVKNWD